MENMENIESIENISHNILLISDSTSYIITSIAQQLEELKYHVFKVDSDADKLSKIKDSLSAAIIYVEDVLLEDIQALVYIKDRAIEEDIPLYLIGDSAQIAEVENTIPKDIIVQKFLRPVNVKEIVSALDTFIKKEGKHNKKKILVVDDSGAMLRNVKGWLEGKYQVILANSAAMAIKYLALNKPDLILLDYEMPVCDGKQTLEMIRSEMEFSSIPVIFLTSKSDKESVMKVMALKPEGYLLKTMEPAQIVQSIDEFFEKRKGSIK
ncbi:MAG: response regulator [Lachnospiraceae bacterium]|nr:response regulator [Lachnospiraceae bacterium]